MTGMTTLMDRVFSMEEASSWYNSKSGINHMLTSLRKFIRLIKERYAAAQERQEKLEDFYVLGGRFLLSAAGGCSALTGISSALRKSIPSAALTREEFYAVLEKHQAGRWSLVISNELNGGNIPNETIRCPYCKKGWDISNCHDLIVRLACEIIPLEKFVGQTLKEIQAAYAARTDAVYWMQPDQLIRKYGRCWLGQGEGIVDDYVIQVGDEGFFYIRRYFHRDCDKYRAVI